MAIENSLRYDVVLIDFHHTLTSNKARLAYALNQTYWKFFRRNVTPEEFQALLNRPEGISHREHLNTSINGHLSEQEKALLINTFDYLKDRLYVPKHRPLLRQLHELGVTTAIVTNGVESDVKRIAYDMGITPYLTAIYGKGINAILGDVPRKPHPLYIDKVIEDLRNNGVALQRHRTLMVGDYVDDIAAGNNAGLHTALLITGPNQRPEDLSVRPTYALLDSPTLISLSPWIRQENTYLMRDLPKIVAGDI